MPDTKPWSKITHSIFGKQNTKKIDSDSGSESWSKRITDRHNYWLNAIAAEDDGMFQEAVKFYIQDIPGCLEEETFNRAALSCSCAANCVAKMGNKRYASLLYFEAAIIYEQNADFVLDYSTKESLWSLEQSYEHYILAESKRAQVIYSKYMSLTSKVNPLFGLKDGTKSAGLRKDILSTEKTISSNKIIAENNQEIDLPVVLIKEIEDLVKTIRSFNESLRRLHDTDNTYAYAYDDSRLKRSVNYVRIGAITIGALEK